MRPATSAAMKEEEDDGTRKVLSPELRAALACARVRRAVLNGALCEATARERASPRRRRPPLAILRHGCELQRRQALEETRCRPVRWMTRLLEHEPVQACSTSGGDPDAAVASDDGGILSWWSFACGEKFSISNQPMCYSLCSIILVVERMEYLFILLEVESCVFTQLCSCYGYVVALARILFPTETKVAIDIAQVDVDGTLELTLGSGANPRSEIQWVTVDINETPLKLKDEQLARIRALSKTVELGKHFFPRCSNVLDKIIDDEELASLVRGTSTDKKRRFHDLQDLILKAFNADKEEFSRSSLSSSSLSTSIGSRSLTVRSA